MFHTFSSPLLVKVQYATLFGYNRVLQRVFEAPAEKVALRVEMPGAVPQDYTYGRLQRDVVQMADLVVSRREAVCAARGERSLGWVQASKPPEVRSLFAQGERTPSCDYMKDTGYYTASLMAGPGYTYVVSLLTCWALNVMATPMSVSQRYNDELMYVLEHSGSRMILGETAVLLEKFPSEYETLYVRTTMDVEAVACSSCREVTSNRQKVYCVDTVLDCYSFLQLAESGEVVSGVLFDSENLEELNPLFRRWYEEPSSRPQPYDDCLMIYTSGTTARPKGAVHTHASVSNMVSVLQTAWAWSSEDSILHVLPVHHIHGLVNILLCALATQARCVFMKFGPKALAQRLENGDITLFMAVPTIYSKIIAAMRAATELEKQRFKEACLHHVRLMVSGSAALPVPTLQQFEGLSGHVLLERYGMTEVGMALSQPLRPVEERIPGTVGSPLPTVRALVFQSTEARGPAAKGEGYDRSGALAIASESLFDRYWNNPTATKQELCVSNEGMRFFATGDTVGVKRATDRDMEVYTILGRTSIDIIKSRGYKLSALEIEAALLSRKDLFFELAVVGERDKVLGERVVAIAAMQPEAVQSHGIHFSSSAAFYESEELNVELKGVARGVLAPYKIPERFIIVPDIPRNATGKVNKKSLKALLHLA